MASSDVGFSIKLESLQEEHKKFSRCHYEPELFPGLIYKMEQPKVVLLIFTSGKIVLAGAKTRQEIYLAYQKIYPVLFNFKKKQRINLEHLGFNQLKQINLWSYMMEPKLTLSWLLLSIESVAVTARAQKAAESQEITSERYCQHEPPLTTRTWSTGLNEIEILVSGNSCYY